MLHIRNLLESDYGIVDLFMRELHGEHYRMRPDFYTSSNHPYTITEYNELLLSENYIAIAAEEKEILGIGIASIRSQSGMITRRTAYIEAIYVSREHRRSGIGYSIMHEIEKRAVEKRAERIDLMVWSFNNGAKHFYQSMGMIEQRHFMEKKL